LPADVEVVAMRREEGEPARAVRFVRDAAAAATAANAATAATAVRGPATIALADATLFVAAGWTATPLQIGGWMLERHA
jgi:uncharacterized membrane-anchored protein